MKLHFPSIFLGVICTLAISIFCSFQGTIHPISILTPQQKAVLDLLTVETLPDCVGGPGYKTLRVTGANLQVVNGLGITQTTNGLGNLIVGYRENPVYSCEGSHNIIFGLQNGYSEYGGLVGGFRNYINNSISSIISGSDNIASGNNSFIAGGSNNESTGINSCILGGQYNFSFGNTSCVTGGYQNISQGTYSIVTGGILNVSFAGTSVVSGGNSRTSSTPESWVAGSLYEPN